MPERSNEPALAVHCQVTRSPNRRQADIASKDGVFCSLLADRLGDLLRVDQPLAGRADRQIVERLAHFAIVLSRLSEVRAVTLLLQQRQQRRERFLNDTAATE